MSKFIHSIGRDNYYDIVDDQVNPINQKLNEILNLLHKINDQINAPPQTPKNLPIRSPMLPLPSPPIDLQKKKEIPFEKPLPPPPLDILDSEIESVPPPRPPKTSDSINPEFRKDGSLLLTASQALCLTLQLKAVRMFIDQSFEDEYVDKELNMHCLDSAIRTLTKK